MNFTLTFDLVGGYWIEIEKTAKFSNLGINKLQNKVAKNFKN